MAAPYVDDLRILLGDLATPPVEVRHFFGGAAAYVDGRIFMSLTKVGLALKLSEDDRAALAVIGATPLRYFPKAPIKKQYVVLPPALAQDPKQVGHWARRSIDYVRA